MIARLFLGGYELVRSGSMAGDGSHGNVRLNGGISATVTLIFGGKRGVTMGH